jgi:glucosyl-3-phosphoglycerate synthase
LCDNYDHKHQDLSPRDPDKGLNKMAVDITRSLLHRMAAEGIKLDAGLFDSLLSAYMRQAEDTLRFYSADAVINGLVFPRHEEENAVTTFVRSLQVAEKKFLEDPLGAPLISNWNRVQSAVPEFFSELNEAVRLDNETAS